MPIYPGALPTIPDDGTWNLSQVGDEIEAIATELGTNPSAAFTDVASRFTAAENRLTAVEGATTTAGVEIGAVSLTTDYDVRGQTTPTTFTDVPGLSISVGAQTRAYNLMLSCTFVATAGASLTPPKMAAFAVRIVDSGVTTVAEVSQLPIIFATASATLFAKGVLVGRIAPGQAATTWKVQARMSAALDANITAAAIYAGNEAPGGGVTRRPALLQAITV